MSRWFLVQLSEHHAIFSLSGLAARPHRSGMAMVVDPGRNSRVGSDQQGKPVFDGPEDSTEKMEVQHTRSPEPAVIGNRDQGVRIRTLGP